MLLNDAVVTINPGMIVELNNFFVWILLAFLVFTCLFVVASRYSLCFLFEVALAFERMPKLELWLWW